MKLVDCSELEEVIARDPYDDASWSVLEDFLLQHEHDPRAELIKLAKANLRGEEAQVRGNCLPLLLGKKHESLSHVLTPQWRAGYLLDARLDVHNTRSLNTMVTAFVAAPAARLLRELEITTGAIRSLGPICAVLAQAPFARTLRCLKFAQVGGNVVGPAALECEMISGLQLVELDTDEMPILTPSVLPTLERLRSRAMSRHQLENFLKGSLPSLRFLALDLRPAESWQTPTDRWLREITEGLERVANGDFAPQLKTVHFRVNEGAIDAVREVLEAGAVTRACERAIW